MWALTSVSVNGSVFEIDRRVIEDEEIIEGVEIEGEFVGGIGLRPRTYQRTYLILTIRKSDAFGCRCQSYVTFNSDGDVSEATVMSILGNA